MQLLGFSAGVGLGLFAIVYIAVYFAVKHGINNSMLFKEQKERAENEAWSKYFSEHPEAGNRYNKAQRKINAHLNKEEDER
jgi:hypothetical protein